MNNVSAGGGSNLGNGNYTSLQAFPHSTGLGPMSLLSLNISQNPKATGGANLMTTSHSQTNLSALTSSQLPLQVFRNGSGSSAGTSGSRDQSPTYQNWSQNHQNSQNFHPKDEAKNTNSASDCTSSTECSEDSDRNSDHANENKKIFLCTEKSQNQNTPTPAPRTTLE